MELIAVTNDRLDVATLAGVMIKTEPYVDHFIIRERKKTAAEYIELIDRLNGAGIDNEKLIVNDRVGIAVVSGINKVQLPSHGLAVHQVKTNFPQLNAGRSIHSKNEAIEAEKSGASWLLYGHVFPTECKSDVPERGLTELKMIVEAVSCDVYAIGGIKPRHVEEIGKINIKGIAVMSTIFDSVNPVLAAKEYFEACRSYHSVERN